jgi:hypothetical protein
MTLWSTKDISFDFVEDMTDDPVVTVRILRRSPRRPTINPWEERGSRPAA